MRREYEVATYFEAVAGDYADRYEDSGPAGYALAIRWRHIANRLGSPSRLLDAGCGPGVFLRYCRDRGIDATGIDISTAMAKEAGNATAGVLTSLPYADASFDTVTAMGAVEYVGDDETAIGELVRVTQHGGRVLITFPNRSSLFRIWRKQVFYPVVSVLRPLVYALRRRVPPPPVTQHHHAYDSLALQRLLQSMNCRIDRVVFYNAQVALSPLDELLPSLAVTLSRFFESRLPSWAHTAFLVVATKR